MDMHVYASAACAHFFVFSRKVVSEAVFAFWYKCLDAQAMRAIWLGLPHCQKMRRVARFAGPP
jgi:hypothetical protein